MARRTVAAEPSLANKLELELPLTPAEIQYLEHKPVLDAGEAAWRLGISRRQLIKQLHATHQLRADATVPGSNRLRWSKASIDRALRAWGADARKR